MLPPKPPNFWSKGKPYQPKSLDLSIRSSHNLPLDVRILFLCSNERLSKKNFSAEFFINNCSSFRERFIYKPKPIFESIFFCISLEPP